MFYLWLIVLIHLIDNQETMMFIKDLLSVIPNSDYKYRKDIDFKKVVEQAKEKGYTTIVVVNEDQKKASILFNILFII